ncbi:hypothetical protein [Intestinibacter sp.]|uniref:hypothetical protein n=1 Tax=Intestinibacter sp. TaxID=1965304 RepID=UPI002A750638|nr:hypothetical protein [Intestinibacter sp.]
MNKYKVNMLNKKDVLWLDKLEKILENQDIRPDADSLLTIYSGIQEIIKNDNKELIKEVLKAVDYESSGQTESVTNVLRKKYDI